MKIGFIGCGHMGAALAAAAAKGEKKPTMLFANRTAAKAEQLAERIGGSVCEMSNWCGKVILCFWVSSHSSCRNC